MAARRLWLIFAGELSTYALVIALLNAKLGIQIVVLVAAVPVAMLGVRIALVLGSFLFAALVERGPPIGFVAWLKMIALEFLAFLRFQVLIATHPHNDRPASEQEANLPLLVLLHGVYCNGAIWRPIVHDLQRRTGCAIRTPDLEPPLAALEVQARSLAKWLQTAAAVHPARPIIVVAHSLGGLMVRQILLEHPSVPLRAIYVGTPHRGTLIARALRALIGRDLRQKSAALAVLERGALPHDAMNIYTLHDNLVVPASTSELAGVRNRTVIGCGHMALIYSREVRDLLCDEIGRVLSTYRGATATT